MSKKLKYLIFILFANIKVFAQIPNFPSQQTPNQKSLYKIPITVNSTSDVKNRLKIPDLINSENDKTRKQNDAIFQETQKEINAQIKETNQRKTANKIDGDYRQSYSLTSLSDKAGTQSYYSAFDNLLKLNPEDYSIADATFLVENAFYDKDENFQNTFQKYIQRATKTIQAQISNKGISDDDNASKNLEIFNYFSRDTKQNGKIIHKAMKYDFNDYFGEKDYSKMFVSKLMKTNTGQCHSMPLLYLILAEQVGANANLVMSPNHSYIRFKNDEGEMQGIELTNGMFSTDTFVLNSGFIKSEALQNKIYMQDLTKKELLSQTFVDLASGYIHKFGYDEFVAKVLNKALELNPNNINAMLWKSNTDQKRFLEASNKLGINPNDKADLQNIKNYPNLVFQLKNINNEFEKIDQSGFSSMTAEQYGNWLGSIKRGENKQKNDEISEQIKAANLEKQKEALKKSKHLTPKKEAPKIYKIPKEWL